MNATTINRNWDDANYRYLSAALAVVRDILENYAAKVQNQPQEKNQENLPQALEEAAAAMPAPSALERVCTMFSLSFFERNLLLLCAGMELNGDFAKLCAVMHGDSQRAYPTLSLALAAFLAADAGEAVQMKHVLRAAQTEYSKLEKPLTDAEIGGWM